MYRFEIEITSTHILVLLTVAAVVYAGYAMYFLIRENRRAGGSEGEKRTTTSQSENNKFKDDIMGKSKFVMTRNVPPPQAAVTIVSTPEHPRQIAQDELDEIFGRAPEGERNEPLKIHHPLYVGRSLQKKIADDHEDDENEDLPLRSHCHAQGVRFEELGDAYNGVVYNPPLTEKEEVATGRILLDLKHTDMFEYIVSGDRKRQSKALYLIDTYLTAFQRRMMAEGAESDEPQNGVVAPQGYSIGDDASPIRRPR
jgi:hypothetical protein